MRLSKTYEPNQYEADIYALWEKSQAFAPKNRGNSDNFCIVIPPPNANGDLHLGHGLTLCNEDILVRYQRMLGKKTLFLPGADHAGFETQVVYEKKLAEAGKSRFDFSREELYRQIWDFVAQNKDNYESQFRKIGASLNWSHYVYTLDKKIIDRSYKTFKKMWDEGLIYRGERLVNFCTQHGTGFADIEVAYQEIKGHLWHIKYPLTDGSGFIEVATTRPETMLGDTAVAVHPSDKRYKNFVGKTVKLPLTDREIPIVADKFVDKDFGTGAVKITPAHDPNDFEVAKRHDLPMITVIGHDGKTNHNAPKKYQSLTVAQAREQVVKDLDHQGFLLSTEDYLHSVGHCYKCGTVIEPLLKEQWFIDMKPLASEAIKALGKDKITFHPEQKCTQLVRYLKELKDWNISRQIAWGIPIPAFVNSEDPEDWVYDERVDQQTIKIGNKTYHRDPDVFDTWFSSASWPYATLDYPDSQDFKDFYPLDLMETGHDILFPWVSRMIMFGLYVTGDVPFKAVYLHGLINDQAGQKMSKSKGNVVDPMGLIDKYGSDAFRLGITAGQSAGNDRAFDESKLVAGRNFCNKLWNIARFVEDTIGSTVPASKKPKPDSPVEHWVIGQINQATAKLGELLDRYEFSEGYELVYHLVWDDVADWYIEAAKTDANPAVLRYVLDSILKLTHPYAPFVTETIWQTLYASENTLLAISSWPKSADFDQKRAARFEQIKSIISEVRQLKALAKHSGGKLYYADSKLTGEVSDFIKKMAKLDSIQHAKAGEGLKLTQTNEQCWLDLGEKATAKLAKALSGRRQELQTSINTLSQRLDSPNYAQKAPADLVEQTKDQLQKAKHELAAIDEQSKQLKF